jgi:hypothetical protein
MSTSTDFSDIKINDYSDKCIAVQGDTRKYKEDLKQLGGKYNANLKGGPGWVFSKSNEKQVKDFINKGVHISEEQKNSIPNRSSYVSNVKESFPKETTTLSSCSPSLIEVSMLYSKLNNLENKINKIDTAISLLLNDNQKRLLDTIMKSSSISDMKSKEVKSKPIKNEESDYEVESGSDVEVTPVKQQRLLR